MVVVDFMIGFVTSILTAYWCCAVYQTKKSVFGPVRFSITFLNISVKRLMYLKYATLLPSPRNVFLEEEKNISGNVRF